MNYKTIISQKKFLKRKFRIYPSYAIGRDNTRKALLNLIVGGGEGILKHQKRLEGQ